MFTQRDLIEIVEKTMPFGKYQGRRLIDIPEEYLLWMQRKGFPDGQLGYHLQLVLELKIHGTDDVLQPLKKQYPAKLQHPTAEGKH